MPRTWNKGRAGSGNYLGMATAIVFTFICLGVFSGPRKAPKSNVSQSLTNANRNGTLHATNKLGFVQLRSKEREIYESAHHRQEAHSGTSSFFLGFIGGNVPGVMYICRI